MADALWGGLAGQRVRGLRVVNSSAGWRGRLRPLRALGRARGLRLVAAGAGDTGWRAPPALLGLAFDILGFFCFLGDNQAAQIGQRRQIFQAGQAQVVQEFPGGGVQAGSAWHFFGPMTSIQPRSVSVCVTDDDTLTPRMASISPRVTGWR